MLVSVVMSVYNSEKYLEEAIVSILKQTYTDFEFLIIDDGSKDQSLSIIEKYHAVDPRIILIKNDRNIGLPGSLNKGIKLAKGNYIARQDADDVSSLDRLEIQMDFALKNPDIDLIGSNNFLIDVNGEVVYENKSHSSRNNYFEYLLTTGGIFTHGCALIKKEKLVNVGLYDTRFYYSQDGELWLRLLSNGASIHILNEPLYYYRSAPRAFNKKSNIQRRYNKVKRMIYAEEADNLSVENELSSIQEQIVKGALEPREFHMADYWRSLANAAYLHNAGLRNSFKYLFKAAKEKNSISQYPKYLLSGISYLLPVRLIKRIISV